ncbi:MAG: DUF7344 domain-containing protein [Halorhabdus sp.]
MYEGTADLSTSDRHKILGSKQRRVTLKALSERSEPVDLMDLAAAIAAGESDGDVASEATVEKVAIELHHTHLPMMAEFGLIDYDPGANRVEPHPRRPDS